jgi:hypothetical protein
MKRFTDTAKWSKQWFQDLPPHLKCFWNFICDNADAAGVWEPNFKLASFQIGKTVSEADLIHFGDRVGRTESGKLALVSFIEFQYGKLSADCKAHIPVFRLLEKHRLPHSLSIPYTKAIHSLKEEEEEKETETETETETEGPIPFEQFWQAYPRRIGKGNAEKAWEKHGCSALLPQILTAVRKCKVSADWTKDAGQFIPHPATWLNRKGWEDEMGPRSGATSTIPGEHESILKGIEIYEC